jgi:hypothetical protein
MGKVFDVVDNFIKEGAKFGKGISPIPVVKVFYNSSNMLISNK